MMKFNTNLETKVNNNNLIGTFALVKKNLVKNYL